jgi:hypothetical protein
VQRKIKHTLFALFACLTLQAQVNLIPNGSFEILDTCPLGPNKLRFARQWFSPTAGSPDLYNSCANTQWGPGPTSIPESYAGVENPKDGIGYAGISIYYPDTGNYQEYIAIKLDTILEKKQNYCFTMYCNLADAFFISYQHDGLNPYPTIYATNSIGVYFSPDSIFQNNYTVLPYLPQIQNPTTNIIDSLTGWKRVNGYFRSETGGEQYIYIGNFNTNANTPLTVLYPGENPEPWIYFFLDDISLYACESFVGVDENLTEQIAIYPNPAQDFVSVKMSKNVSNAMLNIYNLTGQLISQKQITQSDQTIPITELDNGVYIFVIQNEDTILNRQRIIIAK